jgi:UDP-N-acetylmuramate--alanine ligase
MQDESDGSFLRYQPRVGIITSIEPDHLDHYGSVPALHAAFADFARSCEVLIGYAGDAVVRDVAGMAAQAGVHVLTYDQEAGADVVVTPDAVSGFGGTFPLTLPLPGDHNRLNAAAAWAAAVTMGADPERAASALADFGGTGRRFQMRGEAGGVRVIDDYAHHPTEVAAVIAAARAAGAGHLVVLFQPALFTRTQEHFSGFARALSVPDADIVLAPVHGDREDPIEGVTSELIAREVDGSVQVADSLEDAARIVAELAKPGTTVLTVGSGTVTKAPDWILAALEAR